MEYSVSQCGGVFQRFHIQKNAENVTVQRRKKKKPLVMSQGSLIPSCK